MASVGSDRVINLPANKIDPDSSGTGAMLLNEMITKPAELQQKDALEAIQDKYRAQSQARANDYDTGLTELKSHLHMQETEATWQHEQALRQKEAAGLQSMIGGAQNEGIDMPGLTHTEGEAPEAGYNGIVPNEVNPNAITEARQMFLENFKTHVAFQNHAQTEELTRTMGLMTTEDSAQAKQLAAYFRTAGDTVSADKIEAAYGTPGMGDRNVWQKTVLPSYMEKLQIAQASMANKLAVAREITDRQKDIANIKAQVARMLAQGKIDDKGYTELNSLHTGIQRNISTLMQRRNQLLQSQIMATGPDVQVYQSNIDAIDRLTEAYQEQATAVQGKMAGWQNQRFPQSPAGITPGTGGANAPPQVSPTPAPKPGGGTNWTRDPKSGKLMKQ